MAGFKGSRGGMKKPVASQVDRDGMSVTTIDGSRSKAKKMKATVSTGFKAKPTKGGRKKPKAY